MLTRDGADSFLIEKLYETGVLADFFSVQFRLASDSALD
jgi:hypothetical protein